MSGFKRLMVVPFAASAVLAAEPTEARSWLQDSDRAAQRWDLPFLTHARKPVRRTRTPDQQREVQRELERELNRRPQTQPAVTTATAFPEPSPLPPAVMTAPPELPASLACAGRLADIARYTPLPDRSGPGQCGASDLVQLDAVTLPGKATVALNPAPQLRCGMAEQLARWIRDDVVRVTVEELGSPVASVATNDSYDCRPRNNIKGAKLSEHGRANALDITSIRLRNGGVFTLTDKLVSRPFRDRLRESACTRFTTVLGPGSDAYHSEHVHLDLAERTRGVRICQWDVREQEVAATSGSGATSAAAASVRMPLRKPEALATQARSKPLQASAGSRWPVVKRKAAPTGRAAPQEDNEEN